MIVVTMIPFSATAGGSKSYHPESFDYETATGKLTLRFRDRTSICFETVGSWRILVEEKFGIRPHTADEAERIHNGSALVMVT